MAGFYRVCVIDTILEHSPADYVRPPTVPAESPTLGLAHLQFEALITTARLSTNPNDFAVVALSGLPGLRIFEACGSNIADLGEEHGHRVLREHLAQAAGIRMPRMHPHMLPDTFVTTMLDAGVSLPTADRRPPRRSANHHALRPGPQEPRPAPQPHPGLVHGLRDIASARGSAGKRKLSDVSEPLAAIDAGSHHRSKGKALASAP